MELDLAYPIRRQVTGITNVDRPPSPCRTVWRAGRILALLD